MDAQSELYPPTIIEYCSTLKHFTFVNLGLLFFFIKLMYFGFIFLLLILAWEEYKKSTSPGFKYSLKFSHSPEVIQP